MHPDGSGSHTGRFTLEKPNFTEVDRQYIGHYGRQDYDDVQALHAGDVPHTEPVPIVTFDMADIERRILAQLLGWRRHFLRFVPARIQVAVLAGRTGPFNTIVAGILLFPWSLLLAVVMYFRHHK